MKTNVERYLKPKTEEEIIRGMSEKYNIDRRICRFLLKNDFRFWFASAPRDLFFISKSSVSIERNIRLPKNVVVASIVDGNRIYLSHKENFDVSELDAFEIHDL